MGAYVDLYQFPSSAGQFASGGRDILIEANPRPSGTLDALVRYQSSLSSGPAAIPGEFTGDMNSDQRIRCQIGYRLSRIWTLRTRAEWVRNGWRLSGEAERGGMVYEDFAAQLSASWSAEMRMAVFHTSSWDARVPVLEHDLDGVFSLPSYWGTGARWYMLLHYDMTASIQLSVKYADLRRDDVKYIGSGPDQISTNHLGTVGAQIDAAF